MIYFIDQWENKILGYWHQDERTMVSRPHWLNQADRSWDKVWSLQIYNRAQTGDILLIMAIGLDNVFSGNAEVETV